MPRSISQETLSEFTQLGAYYIGRRAAWEEVQHALSRTPAQHASQAFQRGMETAAGIADLHERETLAEATHKEWSSCEHPECCEQRSMAKTAREIGKDIRAEAERAGKEQKNG